MSEAYNAGNLWNYGSTSMYSIYLFLHIAIIYCTEWVLFTQKVEGYELILKKVLGLCNDLRTEIFCYLNPSVLIHSTDKNCITVFYESLD